MQTRHKSSFIHTHTHSLNLHINLQQVICWLIPNLYVQYEEYISLMVYVLEIGQDEIASWLIYKIRCSFIYGRFRFSVWLNIIGLAKLRHFFAAFPEHNFSHSQFEQAAINNILDDYGMERFMAVNWVLCAVARKGNCWWISEYISLRRLLRWM